MSLNAEWYIHKNFLNIIYCKLAASDSLNRPLFAEEALQCFPPLISLAKSYSCYLE